MNKIKKKPLIIALIILCLVSVFAGGGTAVLAAPESHDVYVNINEPETRFTAAELLEAMGVTDYTDDVRNAAYFVKYDANANSPFLVYDEALTVVDFIGNVTDTNTANAVRFTQKRTTETAYRTDIGTMKMKVKIFVDGREVLYNVNVQLVAAVPQNPQPAVIRIGSGTDSDAKAILYRNTATQVDFVYNETDGNDEPNLVFLKNQLIAKTGILNLGYNDKVFGDIGGNGISFYVNKDGIEVIDAKPDSGAADSKIEIINETSKGFSFRVNGNYASRVTIPVVFEDKLTISPKRMTVNLVFSAISDAVSSEPIVKEIDSLKVSFLGLGEKTFSLTDFFKPETIQAGSTIRLIESSKTQLDNQTSYNPAKVSVKATEDYRGITITPKGNGYTCISMDYEVVSPSGGKINGHLSVPVEVTGVYTFGTIDTTAGVDKVFSANFEKFQAAFDDGYVFYSVQSVADESIAEVRVENGKLMVTPKVDGNTTAEVVMINPQLDDPEANLITVSVPIKVAEFSLFSYLSTAGIITLFTTIGVVAAVIIILIILGLIRSRKNKKLKKQIMRAAESKLLQKQEIQARQRASMMPFPSMMYRPQGLALNAAGGAPQTVLGISAMPQQPKPKPVLELNTAEKNTGFDSKTAVKSGTKKADAFIEEAMAKAKREADEKAKREAERKKQEEQRLKREAEAAKKAAKLKQQKAIEEEQRKKEAEQKRAMEQERMLMQQKLENERERLEAEKQKMQQEQEKAYLDGKRTEAINLNASLLDLYRQLASIDKLLFVKDMELAKTNKNIALANDALANAEHDEDKVKIAEELEQLAADAKTVKAEISELEDQAASDDARRIKEESHVDAIVADCKFEDLKAEFQRQRTELMRSIEEEYERYTKDFKNEFNTKEALEQAEKLRRDMIAQTERTKKENLRKAIESKLTTIEQIVSDTESITDLTALAQTEGKLNGVIAALLPEEKTQEVDDKVAEAQKAIAGRRDDLERALAEAKEAQNREKRDAAEKAVRELAAQMTDILKQQFELDKQSYLNNFNKTRAEAKLRVTRERLSTAQTDEESGAINAELKTLNDTLSELNTELAALELQSDAQNNAGAELEGKLDALVRENELADLRKEIDYESEILQKDLNNEYQKFIAKHKEDVQRQDAIEEAERVRRQMLEQAEKIKREAFRELIASKKKTLGDIAEEIKLADTEDRLNHYESNLKDFEATLKDEERIPELMDIVSAARETVVTRRKDLAAEAKRRAEEARVAEENAAKLKSAVEAKRRELLGIKGEIPTITDKKSADMLLAKLTAFTDALPDELRVPEVMVPVDKVHDSIVHAGEMAELRNTKVPQKKVIKKVVNTINKVKRPAPKKPGTAAARPAGARPAGAARPAGTRPAGAASRPAGAARPAPRPAGAARPAARPAGARLAQRPAGARPAARPAGARPAGVKPAARPGSRPAPKR